MHVGQSNNRFLNHLTQANPDFLLPYQKDLSPFFYFFSNFSGFIVSLNFIFYFFRALLGGFHRGTASVLPVGDQCHRQFVLFLLVGHSYGLGIFGPKCQRESSLARLLGLRQ
jgi:hypothetical protein